jgi:ribosomal protein S18 acetylase RimI-like enzyme
LRPEIRSALPSEAQKVHALLVEAFERSTLPFTVYRSPLSVGRLADLARAGRVRVAGPVEGVAICTDDHLDYIAVDRRARGTGLGRLLMDDFHKSGGRSLDAFTDNPRSLDWYGSLGYLPEKETVSVRLALKGSGQPPENWDMALTQERTDGFAAVGHAGMRIGLLAGQALRLLDTGGRSVPEALAVLKTIGYAGRNELVMTGLRARPTGHEVIQCATSVRMRREQ